LLIEIDGGRSTSRLNSGLVVIMSEERPAKIRKVTHGDEDENGDVAFSASGSPEIQVDDGAGESDDDDQYENSELPVAKPTEPKADPASVGEAKPMSKNQLKKQRKRDEWEAGRDYRKAKRKQKAKEKKERKRAANEESRVNGETILPAAPKRPRNPVQLPITFIFDCGFDDLMVEKEMISLGSQLTRAYSDNSRSHYQAHLAVSSWSGKLRERFDTVLAGSYKKWRGMTFLEEDFVKVSEQAKEWMAKPKENKLAGVFAKHARQNAEREAIAAAERNGSAAATTKAASGDKIASESVPATEHVQVAEVKHPESAQQETSTAATFEDPNGDGNTSAIPKPTGEIIYLSSDSQYTLEELQPYSTYIIGGLVDKNRHKGICHKIATQKGFRTAKLPISEFLEMQSRSVLATNHVSEIMLRWLECGDWGKAFMQVMPTRKGAKLKRSEAKNGAKHGDEQESAQSDSDSNGGVNIEEQDAISVPK
jgi:tRNA (guanine9-N1)-methyltransferase